MCKEIVLIETKNGIYNEQRCVIKDYCSLEFIDSNDDVCVQQFLYVVSCKEFSEVVLIHVAVGSDQYRGLVSFGTVYNIIDDFVTLVFEYRDEASFEFIIRFWQLLDETKFDFYLAAYLEFEYIIGISDSQFRGD